MTRVMLSCLINIITQYIIVDMIVITFRNMRASHGDNERVNLTINVDLTIKEDSNSGGVMISFSTFHQRNMFKLSLYASDKISMIIFSNVKYTLSIDSLSQPTKIRALCVDEWMKSIMRVVIEYSNNKDVYMRDYILTEMMYAILYNVHHVMERKSDLV